MSTHIVADVLKDTKHTRFFHVFFPDCLPHRAPGSGRPWCAGPMDQMCANLYRENEYQNQVNYK